VSEGRKRWQKENCLKIISSGGVAKLTHQSSFINKGQFPFRREETVWSNYRCFFHKLGVQHCLVTGIYSSQTPQKPNSC